MAGGKLTPRQKMINLMYLVFIAMLAMNMSKEVLSAFGLMNEKFDASNTSAEETNAGMLSALDKKASEDAHFLQAAADAKKVANISKEFYAYIGNVKSEITKGIEVNKETGKLPYEAMDKADAIDHAFFSGEGYTTKGKDFVDKFNKYVADMKAVIGNNSKLQGVVSEITSKFKTDDVKNKEGIKVKFLDYHFKGFPAIASLAKMTSYQNDVKKAEADVFSILLGKAAVEASSMKNFTALVVLDKNAYFQGEKVTGKVVLGKYDANTKPTGFKGPGKIVNGQALIDMTAGGVGEQTINGEFIFTEDGQTIPLKFEGKYVVVPRPNSATISADKMNVVYRGVPNPMSISFAGVADSNVNASATGMSKVGNGKYVLRPGTGTSVMINVSAKLPDGKVVSDKKEFRIKGLPAPTGKIRGEVAASGQTSNLASCTISAVMEDFDFPVTVNVTQFNIKVPGQPTIVVSGNKMDARAKQAIAKAGRGDVVVISEIKATFQGIDQVAKRVSTCTYEIK